MTVDPGVDAASHPQDGSTARSTVTVSGSFRLMNDTAYYRFTGEKGLHPMMMLEAYYWRWYDLDTGF